MARTAPIMRLASGHDVHGITTHQERALQIQVARYYRWEASGRLVDPFASGAGKGQRYDTVRVQHGPPVGGYGPGVAADPDEATDSALLLRIADAIKALPLHHQDMIRWRWLDHETYDQLAARLHLSFEVTRGEWRRLVTNLYYALWGAG